MLPDPEKQQGPAHGTPDLTRIAADQSERSDLTVSPDACTVGGHLEYRVVFWSEGHATAARIMPSLDEARAFLARRPKAIAAVIEARHVGPWQVIR